MDNAKQIDDAFRLLETGCGREEEALRLKRRGDAEGYRRLRRHAVENYTNATEMLLNAKHFTQGRLLGVVMSVLEFIMNRLDVLVSGPRVDIAPLSYTPDQKLGKIGILMHSSKFELTFVLVPRCYSFENSKRNLGYREELQSCHAQHD